MKYETLSMEINGYKLWISNDPKKTKNKGLRKRNLYECVLISDDRYGLCLVSGEMLKDESMKPLIVKMLLNEIKSLPAT